MTAEGITTLIHTLRLVSMTVGQDRAVRALAQAVIKTIDMKADNDDEFSHLMEGVVRGIAFAAIAQKADLDPIDLLSCLEAARANAERDDKPPAAAPAPAKSGKKKKGAAR